ncbi:villin [Anaeramoeba flamelloides]|uniref:Villin n=1 Tax=Anaeramoeba flamelloides TaxID=1746091 RepID=A0AAV7YJN4_9EUKA|nr:villin [Anaeramoeba flamelloides]
MTSEFVSFQPGQKPGIEVWRIEKMKVATWKKVGVFLTGDSFIILHTKRTKSGISYDLYFWLGVESSQDEKGVAAYKTVELDDYLGGRAIQYRVVQHHEPENFLAVFKGGIKYEEGGIDSGFKHVVRDQYETRLLHLKGRRNVRVNQVKVAANSLNAGDVFVLDCGLNIYQWNGKDCNKMEKMKGLQVTSKIKDDERGGKAKVHIIAQGEEEEDFWKAIGGKGRIQTAEEGGDDDEFEKETTKNIVLFRVCDESGKLLITEEARPPLKKAMLDTMDCFILDCGSQIFVWIGKGSTRQEKKESMANAVKFLQQNNRPEWTPITRVIENGETPLFAEKFVDWYQYRPRRREVKKTQQRVQKKVDINVEQMHQMRQKESERTIDDGTGTLKIWRIENFKKEDVDESTYGQFFSGDSYIILYTYMQGTRERYIIYFWQGRHSTTDEKGTSALLTVELDEELGGQAVQSRVIQGKEPNHFLSLFKGKMIVRNGGCPSGFRTVNEENVGVDENEPALFHIRGTTDLNTRASQVEAKCSSLNSGDCFVLNANSDIQCIWLGSGSNQDEKDVAQNIAKIIKSNRSQILVMNEGEEPQEFWDTLGGKTEYASEGLELQAEMADPRLFQLSNASGTFKAEEIYNFDQDDLDNDDCFILDVYNEVYLWLGGGSNELEREESIKAVINYVKSAKDGRSKDTPIIRVVAGFEPPLFTCHFLGWDNSKAGKDPYALKLKELMGGGTGDVRKDVKMYDKKVYSYAILTKRPLPMGVKVMELETYLSDEEFKKYMGITRDQYKKLPNWKKKNLKKKAKLF